MNRKKLIVSWVLVCLSTSVFAAQDYLVENSNEPDEPTLHEYKLDLDGDKKPELVKVLYGLGMSNKPLTIEVYRDGNVVSTLNDKFGIQSNYKIEDVDNDGKQEIIIWSGIWDPRTLGEEGVTEATYEGHSAPHRYIVATYKLIRGQYYLWDIYTTKKKYEPFCEKVPRQ